MTLTISSSFSTADFSRTPESADKWKQKWVKVEFRRPQLAAKQTEEIRMINFDTPSFFSIIITGLLSLMKITGKRIEKVLNKHFLVISLFGTRVKLVSVQTFDEFLSLFIETRSLKKRICCTLTQLQALITQKRQVGLVGQRRVVRLRYIGRSTACGREMGATLIITPQKR